MREFRDSIRIFVIFFTVAFNIPQDLVAPLTPSAPYTPISAVHPGVASLHSSPLHTTRHGSPRQGPRGIHASAASSARRLQEVDLRAEIERHKNSLNLDDWLQLSCWDCHFFCYVKIFYISRWCLILQIPFHLCGFRLNLHDLLNYFLHWQHTQWRMIPLTVPIYIMVEA